MPEPFVLRGEFIELYPHPLLPIAPDCAIVHPCVIPPHGNPPLCSWLSQAFCHAA